MSPSFPSLATSSVVTQPPPPPPTSNVLDRQQRSRLVRSARKLGAMLGTTPIVADNEYDRLPGPVTSLSVLALSPPSSISSSRAPSDIKRSRRQASICSLPESSSLVYASSGSAFGGSLVSLLPVRSSSDEPSSLKSVKSRGLKRQRSIADIPRPLILRLEPYAGSCRADIQITTSPSTPTPLTPKGGCLSDTPTPTTSAFCTTPTPTLTPSPLTPVFPSAVELRRRRMKKLMRTLGEIIPPHLVYGCAAPDAHTHAHDTSVTFDSHTPSSLSPGQVRGRLKRSISMDLNLRRMQDEVEKELGVPGATMWGTSHDTWEGEWNREDIRDVQAQLRALRTR